MVTTMGWSDDRRVPAVGPLGEPVALPAEGPSTRSTAARSPLALLDCRPTGPWTLGAVAPVAHH